MNMMNMANIQENLSMEVSIYFVIKVEAKI